MQLNHKFKFEEEYYKNKCQELKDLLSLEKEIAKKKEDLKKAIIELAGGDRMEYGINVKLVTRKGTTDYTSLLKDHFTDEKIERMKEEYRKDSKDYYDVRAY